MHFHLNDPVAILMEPLFFYPKSVKPVFWIECQPKTTVIYDCDLISVNESGWLLLLNWSPKNRRHLEWIGMNSEYRQKADDFLLLNSFIYPALVFIYYN